MGAIKLDMIEFSDMVDVLRVVGGLDLVFRERMPA